MANGVKFQKNAPLSPGDKVRCLKMDDEFSRINPGTPGVVRSVSEVQGNKLYYVNWANGSKLALIEDVDSWLKIVEDEEESINEIVLVRTKKDILNKNY
jgi:hypothetical protein